MGSELRSVWRAFHYEALWQMSWMRLNLILALLPVVGAVILYFGWRRLSILRWPLLMATGLLLPNAPYVVTDLIHLPGAIRYAPSAVYVWAGVLPLFSCLITTGVLSYAFTLHLMRKALRARGWSRRRRVVVEAVVGSLCALGVALGRISRLNSWDVVHPSRLWSGLTTVSLDVRAEVLSLIIVLLAGVVVDWAASGAAHSLRDRVHHR